MFISIFECFYKELFVLQKAKEGKEKEEKIRKKNDTLTLPSAVWGRGRVEGSRWRGWVPSGHMRWVAPGTVGTSSG